MKKNVIIAIILIIAVLLVCAFFTLRFYIKQNTLDKDGMENPYISDTYGDLQTDNPDQENADAGETNNDNNKS